jgi:hypothetical protein
MPKIIAHKVWKCQIDKGENAKLIIFNIESFYNLHDVKDEQEKASLKKAKEMVEPYFDLRFGKCLFGEWLFELSPYEMGLEAKKLKLILLETVDKEREKFERLKRKFSKEKNIEYKREPIPEEVRILIWRRDGGQCVKCGSQENLEYDHIIPVAKGGSNTARNIQLLCEKCNRGKRDNI